MPFPVITVGNRNREVGDIRQSHWSNGTIPVWNGGTSMEMLLYLNCDVMQCDAMQYDAM